MDHQPGKYVARIVDANLLKSAKGTPTVALMMEYVAEGGEMRKLPWFGSLSGGAYEITIDTLVKCGFRSDNLADVAKGPSMFEDIDYEIVIDLEPNPNKGNKIEARVKWINLKGGSGFQKKMESQDAVELCKGFDIKGALMEARLRLGRKKPDAVPAAEIPLPSQMANQAVQEEMDVGF